MLLWRRNVKISHYTVGVGPIETGLLYVVISGLICLMGPVLLTLYGNEFLDNAEQRLLTPTVTYAKESILVIYDDNDDIKIYSTSGLVGSSDIQVDCTEESAQFSSQITQSFDCDISNVQAIELFSYFAYQMSGFSSSEKESLPITQMHQISSSSFRASMRAELTARSALTQSCLLPVTSDSVSSTPAYLPSSIPQWSSSSAISNHTLRDIRFDAITMTERWNAGTADNFELEVTFEFPSVLVSRAQKLWNKIKFYFIQLLAFLIAFCFIFNKLNSYLFESNMFTTFTRIEKTAKSG